MAVGNTRLLDDLNVTLCPGELAALWGPSGSGKTTLLRTVCGLDDPAEGHVLLHGKSPEAWGWPVFRRRVLLVAQQPVVLDAGVEANLQRPFTYQAAQKAPFPLQRARALLTRLGLDEALADGRNARALSVGQQQRLCLVRALLLDPPILLLDEPTSALDADATAALQELVSEEATRRGLAALIVTHDALQAERWCHRRIDLSPPRQAVR